jgi:VWFA-related protein
MEFPMAGTRRIGSKLAILVFCLVLATVIGSAAQAQQSQPPDKKQDIPDAPSASRPPQPVPPLPVPPPSKSGVPPSSPSPANAAPSNAAPSNEPPASPEFPFPGDAGSALPPFKVTTVPGGATAGPVPPGPSDELYRITKNINQVLIPVRVTDEQGRLVNGLLPKDFAVYEDGRKQTMNFFTSDPFSLSTAVVFDLGMPDAAVQKVNQTFEALEGAFSQYDEVAVYTYSSTVGKMTDFSAVGKKLSAVLNQLRTVQGRNNGPAVLGGPLGPQGPTVNGNPVDPQVRTVMTPPQESHVLNDAILAAALDLSKRDKARRKIIFVISDGREIGSTASYRDVLKVLLSNGIAVYGLGVGGTGIPGYSKLQKVHLPRMGYGDILPKYASATAGEVFNETSRDAIETAYSRTIGQARNQYTMGYLARATPSSTYRQIEITLDHPSCKASYRPCMDVYAKDGYYPLPPGR